MTWDIQGRTLLLIYAAMSLMVLVAGSAAGAGTFGLLFDEQTDEAGEITFVDTAAVSFWPNCKKANVTASDPNDFDMTVELNNGTTASYDQTNFSADKDFIYKTKNYWGDKPKMAKITLDGSTYGC